MNDSTNQETLRLKQLLEEVTAADTPSAGDAAQRPDTAEVRDAEGESLREAWLAFAQLIRAADASLPAIALATPQMATPLGPQKLHRRRWLALIAAAAAMLLVAVTFGWRTRGVNVSPAKRGSETSAPKAATNPAHVAKQERPETARQAETAITGQPTHEQPTAVAAKASTWDDPLDTQIVAVSEEIRGVQQNWEHGVDDVDLVRYRMDEVSNSLQNDTL